MKRQFLLKTMLLLFALIVGSSSVWAAKINRKANIVANTSYYIGATTGTPSTDYYLQLPASSGDKGTAVTSASNATVFIFEAVQEKTDVYKIKIANTSNYLSTLPSSSSSNGKLTFGATAAEFTVSDQGSEGNYKIRLSNNSRSIQKNNSGTQFGSYGNTQTDVWLEEATTDPEAEVSTNTLDFGSIVIDETKDLKFDVTPKNLTKKLTITSNNDKYTVDVDEIAYNASKTTVTVTAAPTAIGDNMSGKIIISGEDLDNNVEITLTATVARKESNLAYNPTSKTLTQGEEFTSPTFSKAAGLNYSAITFTSSYNEVATVSNEGVISLGSSTGTAIIKATFAQTDVYEAGEATCTITVNPAGVTPEPSASEYYEKVTSTSNLTDGRYLIVYEDGDVALDGNRTSSNVDKASNTIAVSFDTSGNIKASDETKAAEFEIAAITTGGYSVKSKTNSYYLTHTTTKNTLNTSDDEVANAISFSLDGDAIIAIDTYNIRYNSDSGQERFRYYTSASNVQLYKYIAGSNPDDIDIYVSAAGYATYVSGFDLDFSTNANLKAYIAKEISDKIKMVEVTKAPAGTGLLLHAVDGGGKNYTVDTTDETTDDVTDNLFIAGNDEAVQSTDDSNHNNYILNIVNNKIGFYKAAGQNVAKNRAYLQTTVDASRISLIFDDETTGINAIENGEKATENAVVYNLNGQRVMNPGKGLYIVNGKKVIINK